MTVLYGDFTFVGTPAECAELIRLAGESKAKDKYGDAAVTAFGRGLIRNASPAGEKSHNER